jgi:hypothetical protein
MSDYFLSDKIAIKHNKIAFKRDLDLVKNN